MKSSQITDQKKKMRVLQFNAANLMLEKRKHTHRKIFKWMGRNGFIQCTLSLSLPRSHTHAST